MTRYTTKHSDYAKVLYAAGFKPTEIGRILGREFGVQPSRQTVISWVDDSYRGMSRRAAARGAENRRRRAGARRVFGRVSDEWKLLRISEMREAGVPVKWIVVVARIWWGSDLSEKQVWYRLEQATEREAA